MAEKVPTESDFMEFEKRLYRHIDNLFINSDNGIQRKWLKSKDVRKLLGNISAGKLQEMRIKGEISYSKISGLILYDYDDIVKVLDSLKVK
ncbi:MAG: hypothetical protein A2W99_13270 [Bacteroidetes bacterium GWF2_33_16]|nr:MAG: hypothetical protein A2X00_01005 [Bacteroidetes bacterium GWE2_32_14]OFY06648.1 MAG: hypothetical protein A2W99_13270 [Bacteroidetes bacterium GWF2_33_16]